MTLSAGEVGQSVQTWTCRNTSETAACVDLRQWPWLTSLSLCWKRIQRRSALFLLFSMWQLTSSQTLLITADCNPVLRTDKHLDNIGGLPAKTQSDSHRQTEGCRWAWTNIDTNPAGFVCVLHISLHVFHFAPLHNSLKNLAQVYKLSTA